MYKKAAKFYNRFKAQTGKEPSSIAKPLTSKPDRHKDLDQIRNASSAVSMRPAEWHAQLSDSNRCSGTPEGWRGFRIDDS